jgi:predicted esterase
MAQGNDPHRDQPVLTAGAALNEAAGAMILVHGRGANAADILGVANVLRRPDLAYLAPEAAGHVWYPRPFMTPTEGNEPWLASALATVGRLVAHIEDAGIPTRRIAILGFSQGACLSLEFAARNARRYGGVLALSGGLIGETVDAARYPGSLDGTPVFLGCSDVDPFIPLARVQESTATMKKLGGDVVERIYPGAPHSIVPDEVEQVRRILDRMSAD